MLRKVLDVLALPSPRNGTRCSGLRRTLRPATTCPFLKFHPDLRLAAERRIIHDWGRCSRSYTRSGCCSSTYSSRASGLRPKACFYAIS